MMDGTSKLDLLQGGPILYVAAGGFTSAFIRTIEEADRTITIWTLDDIYRP
jgi:hypothetical protein